MLIRTSFLLAQLHINSLEGKHTPAAVESALKNMSSEVLRTYDVAMERIRQQNEGDKELAERVLSWITFTLRPLTVVELQHALAVVPGMKKMDPSCIAFEESLTSVCVGLVIIEKESQIIRLICESHKRV
jgi:hypothetical protein